MGPEALDSRLFQPSQLSCIQLPNSNYVLCTEQPLAQPTMPPLTTRARPGVRLNWRAMPCGWGMEWLQLEFSPSLGSGVPLHGWHSRAVNKKVVDSTVRWVSGQSCGGRGHSPAPIREPALTWMPSGWSRYAQAGMGPGMGRNMKPASERVQATRPWPEQQRQCCHPDLAAVVCSLLAGESWGD